MSVPGTESTDAGLALYFPNKTDKLIKPFCPRGLGEEKVSHLTSRLNFSSELNIIFTNFK